MGKQTLNDAALRTLKPTGKKLQRNMPYPYMYM